MQRIISLGFFLAAHLCGQQLDQQSWNSGPSAETGGYALPIEAAELATPGATTLLVALGTYEAKILAIDQATISGPRSYASPLDGNVRDLSVIVSGAAKVTLKAPDGFDVVAGPAGIEARVEP